MNLQTLKQFFLIKKVILTMTVFSFSALFLFLCLNHGVSLSPDSDYYIIGARNLIEHKSYAVNSNLGALNSLVHFPPATSAMLAIFSHFNSDSLFDAAKWMNIFCFSTFTSLAFWSILTACGSFIFAFFGAIQCILSYDLIMSSVRIWSEPGYILLVMSALLLQGYSMIHSNYRREFLAGASFFIALSFLSRYVGISLALSSILVLFLCEVKMNKMAYWRFIRNAFTITILPFIVFSIWIVRNYLAVGKISGRELRLGAPNCPINFERFIRFIDQAAVWFLPTAVPRPLRVVFILLISAGIVVLLRHALTWQHHDQKTARALQMAMPFLAYPLVHYAFINITHLLVGDGYPLNYYPDEYRYFSPLHVTFFTGALSIIGGSWHLLNKGSTKVMIVFVFLIASVTNGVRGIKWVYNAYQDGHSGGTVELPMTKPGIQYFLRLKQTEKVWIYGAYSDLVYFSAFRDIQLLPVSTVSSTDSIAKLCAQAGYLFIPTSKLSTWKKEYDSFESKNVDTPILNAEDFLVFHINPKSFSLCSGKPKD